MKKGDLIGICAPSAGVGKKLELYDASLEVLKKEGYQILETEHVRMDDPRGGTAEERGDELSSLFENPEVKAVFCAAGGDFLSEILPHVRWKSLKRNPLWLAGSSDPTSLLFTYTAKYDVATMYGFNAGSFDEQPVPDHLKNALKMVKGKPVIQRTSKMYASKPGFAEDYEGFDTPTEWKSNRARIDASGRCIGGCIDVLKDLIGTCYDRTADFIRRYEEDGFIWYFDNFALSSAVLYRTLLQLRYAGWRSPEHTRAVLIGRTCFETEESEMTYSDAIRMAFPDIPVISEMDIGHTAPHFTMVNGALADLDWENGKAKIRFRYE